MDQEVQERFERIERNFEKMTDHVTYIDERIAKIADMHVELETAQLNAQKAHERLTSKVEDVAENIANLTILVDRLIERDLGRT